MFANFFSIFPFHCVAENQVFQFFVRATDHGTPAMYVDVSVDVYIMSSKDQPPVFEKNDEKSNTVENAPAGTVVANVKLVTSAPAKFRLLSHSNVFAIDGDGQITSIAPLDRERASSYVIGVLAYTDSTPPLTALSEVHLHVIDANDNAPQFENAVYTTSIAENMKEGTSLVRGMLVTRSQICSLHYISVCRSVGRSVGPCFHFLLFVNILTLASPAPTRYFVNLLSSAENVELSLSTGVQVRSRALLKNEREEKNSV